MDNRRLLSPTGTTLAPLEKNIYQLLKGLRGRLSGERLLVAVSGGVDSVVMLHVLTKLRSRLGYEILVGHVNHGVRGLVSDGDAAFVAQLCVDLKVAHASVKLHDLKSSASENTLRSLRYRALNQLAKKKGARFIVTAHHQDDLLETRLMRLLQGTGGRGLMAMTLINEAGVLRPLLNVSRVDIESYARWAKLDWCRDATNGDVKKLRNWIRHQWLGVLRRDHPEYLESLQLSLARLTEEEAGGEPHLNQTPSPDQTFDRRAVVATSSPANVEKEIYNYLRQYAEKRVTSTHVKEFKKRLQSPRKKFSFRLAGLDWQVDGDQVKPG